MCHEYLSSARLLARTGMPLLTHCLRTWDGSSAARACFVANSQSVAARIWKYYRSEAFVVYRPVDLDSFTPSSGATDSDYFLMVGELVRYKRPDLAVEAFNATGRNLVVVGGGPMLAQLGRHPKSVMSVVGPQPFEVLSHYYARCCALIFPGEEDCGIVPVEAIAGGFPVVAYGRAGAVEKAIARMTGILFGRQVVEELVAAVERVDRTQFDRRVLVRHARAFGTSRFNLEIGRLIDGALAQHRTSQRTASDHAPGHISATAPPLSGTG
jgi:glycosyltransferase involved in cell wall biosynthesis